MYLQRVYDIVYGKHAVTTETDGGGNRTRVQKYSTDSSTYLVLSFGFYLDDADTHAAPRRVT